MEDSDISDFDPEMKHICQMASKPKFWIFPHQHWNISKHINKLKYHEKYDTRIHSLRKENTCVETIIYTDDYQGQENTFVSNNCYISAL